MSWEYHSEPQYINPAPAPQQEPKESDRRFLHTFAAGVWLPMLQAAITGVFLGLAAWILLALAGQPRPWAWGIGTWVTVQAGFWLILTWRWLDLTAPLERLTGLDLNGDGYTGDPPAWTPPIKVEVLENNGKNSTFAELPATEDQLVRLATGLLQPGISLSEANWTGPGAPFSRAQFRQLRDELIRRGLVILANEKSANQGYALSSSGRAVMRHFAAMAQAPSPTIQASTSAGE